MDYARVYAEFIVDRRLREASLETFDRHHVLPRCVGGGNEPENIIRLTPSDHLFAHVVLAKIHGGLLVASAIRMSGMRKYNGGRSSRERYAHLRSLRRLQQAGRPLPGGAAEAARLANLGNKHFVGRTHSPEVREAISRGLRVSLNRPETRDVKSANARRQWSDPEMRAKMIKTGRPVSEETREKMRQAARRREK